MRTWPWVWLAPLAGYFLLVAAVPSLTRSLVWLRPGRVSSRLAAATIAIMAFTTLALVAFEVTTQPDLRAYGAALPFKSLGGIMTAGIIFTVLN
jgi:hypothetical protein